MIKRRAFLQGSLAGLAGTAFQSRTPGVAASAGDAGSHLPLYAVVYERGIATSAAFGAAARRLGFSTHGMDGGDITDLWTRHLADQWRKEPGRRAPRSLLRADQLISRIATSLRSDVAD